MISTFYCNYSNCKWDFVIRDAEAECAIGDAHAEFELAKQRAVQEACELLHGLPSCVCCCGSAAREL